MIYVRIVALLVNMFVHTSSRNATLLLAAIAQSVALFMLPVWLHIIFCDVAVAAWRSFSSGHAITRACLALGNCDDFKFNEENTAFALSLSLCLFCLFV